MSSHERIDLLRDRLRRALVDAMRTGDAVAIRTIRVVTSAFDNAQAVPSTAGSEPVPFGTAEARRAALSDADAARIVRAEIDEREAVLDVYAAGGRRGTADELSREVEILQGWLAELDPPRQS